MSNPMKILFQMLIMLAVAGIYGCHSNSVFTSGSIEAVNKNVSLKIGFSDYDRRQIYQYYNSGNRKKLPPGLAKKKQLPPGLQKQERTWKVAIWTGTTAVTTWPGAKFSHVTRRLFEIQGGNRYCFDGWSNESDIRRNQRFTALIKPRRVAA